MNSIAPKRPRSRYLPRFAASLIGVILLLLISAPLAGRPPLDVFLGFALALLLCLITTVLALAALLWGLYKRNRVLARHAGVAVILAAAPLLACVATLGPARLGAPPIHDISTDTVNPPQFVAARSLRSAGENSTAYAGARVAALQRQAYPDIRPLHSSLAPAAALAAAVRTAHSLGWRIVTMDPTAGRIEATASTPVIGFTDDIVIRIQPDPSGSRVDIRSASRVGVGDFGANAARIRLFLRRFAP